MTVPSWVQNSVFYQIFPDRFANGDQENDPPNVSPWSAPPTRTNFQGGDLRGIIQHLDYLADVGINAIYLTPIFLASSNHRYNASDYLTIDPKLGTLQEFHSLIHAAHTRGVRIILDGVFNHCGRGFFAFNDLLENQETSPYRDWFHVKKFPIDAYAPGDAKDYLGWWKIKSLPKFNTDHPPVRKYLLNVARYWIGQGADGWRLDVPNEIDDDDFWAEFRHVVHQANPDAYILGEIWNVSPRWVGDRTFDGLMNYPLREAILGLLGGQMSLTAFANRVEELLSVYPRENVYAMYNLLGSHDTERILTHFNFDQQRVKLANAFLFSYPGLPAIYYGDEIGLSGGKDPDCRGTFPWDANVWNHELWSWYQKLAQIRGQEDVLRLGDYRRLALDEAKGCYAFTRALPGSTVLGVINASRDQQKLTVSTASLGLAESCVCRDLLSGSTFSASASQLELTIPAMSLMLLK